jgi:transposase-like protein
MAKQIPRNVKVAAMKAYVTDGKNLKDAAIEHGVSRESLRRWLGGKVRKKGTYVRKGNKSVVDPSSSISRASMIALKPKTSKASLENTRSNKRWTLTEDELLRDAVLSKMTVKETVDLLGRTSVAICCRKNHLIDNRFINETSKFVMPTGIKRVRKKMETPFDTAEVEAIMDIPADEPLQESNGAYQNIELSDLAKIVRDYGVNITVSMTSRGMEVKMTK